MITYLLDTNIVSHIIRGDIPHVRERLASLPMQGIAVSVVTQAELLYGVAKRGYPIKLNNLVREFLARVDVLPWTAEAGKIYGNLRVQCEAAGTPLAPLDMMIAAHAKALEADAIKINDSVILVTRDRAFSRIPDGLTLEDWTIEKAK